MKDRITGLIQFSWIKKLRSFFPIIETKNFFKNSLVIIAYTISTVLLTYPVSWTIGTNVPGKTDAFQWMNTLVYTNFALSHPEITSLNYNNMIFYPTGIPVMPFPSAYNQIISLLLLPLYQIQVIYSLLWLLSFILAAFGAYLLVRYLTRNDYAAFLSGIIFAFTPYHFIHGLGHMGATTIQWIPFCALFFMKIFREGGIKNCIFAGIFYILVAMSDMQYMVFMGIFIAVLFVYEHLICLRSSKTFFIETHKSILVKYLIFGIVAFSVIVPLALSDIQVASSENNFLKPNASEAVVYSNDLLSFFLPSVLHPVFGNLVTPVYHYFTGNATEYTTYIGYTVLILSIFAFLSLYEDRTVRFWGFVAVLFSLFSLGPVLHVAGKMVFTDFNVTIPLPYIFLYYFVPFIENIRTTGRFFIIAALAFSVLAGYGCRELIKRYDAKKLIIVLFLGGLIIFEYLSVPFPTSTVDQPEFYQKIGKDPEQYALLEIPISTYYDAGVTIIYYQTLHKKPVVGGQAGRTPADARDFEMSTPFVHELTFIQPLSKDIIQQNVSGLGNSVLSHYNIRYIILHTKYLTADQRSTLDGVLSKQFATPVIYKNDSLIVYEVKNETSKSFIFLKNGWYTVESWSGTPTRWIKSNATLIIHSDENKNVTMNMDMLSFRHERTLDITINDTQVAHKLIPTNLISLSIPLSLHKGENSLRLNTVNGCERPSLIFGSKSTDERCLSLAVQNIAIG